MLLSCIWGDEAVADSPTPMPRRPSVHSIHSIHSIHSVTEGKPGPKILDRISSNENASVLSRTITATSINSQTSINTSFESNWLPNSFVVSQKKYNVSLKLSKSEIQLLRKSWSIVTSTESRADDEDDDDETNSLRRLQSRTSSIGTNNTSTQSASVLSSAVKPGQTFNTSDFSSYLFCIQFYNNLVSAIPDIERIIPNIKHQASAFAGVIQVAVDSLEDLTKMKESLLNLGHLHARILGIDAPWFKTMGHALIKTFQDWFGDSPESFPLELEEAWMKLYCFLANSILQGGVDPVIEYNVHPGKSARASLDERESDHDDDYEGSNVYEDLSSIMGSGSSGRMSRLESYTAPSLVEGVLKKNALGMTSSNNSSFIQPMTPPTTAASTPLAPALPKKSYMSNVASKNINKLKKNRGEKDDCTIM